MINVEETTKVIITPKDVTSLESFSLKLGDITKSIIISENNIYEARETGLYCEYDNKSAPQLPCGEPVRSLLIENAMNYEDGAVLSNPNFITLSIFDVVFPYMRWIASRLEMLTTRFQTCEDLVNGFLDWTGISQSIPILEASIRYSIMRISECIEENNEQYFKASKKMMNALLASKISNFVSLVCNNPKSSLARLIGRSLGDAVDDIPSKVYEQQVTRFCTEFVFKSYLGDSLRNEYDVEYGEGHLELSAFLESFHARQTNSAVAGKNLASITTKRNNEHDRVISRNVKNFKAVKKQIKKVAIGKGALDQFFKPN